MDTFFGFNTTLPGEHDGGGVEEVEEEEFGRRFFPHTTARTAVLRSPLQRRCKEDISDEEEYDALNDETFGAADKGDWEDIHENLVRLERGRNACLSGEDDGDDASSGDLLFEDYEFDLQLSKLTQYDTNDESGRSSVVAQSIGDEFASKLRLDPSIWESPLKVETVPSSPQQQPQQYDRKSNVTSFAQPNAFHHAVGEQNASRPSGLFPPMKMLSVEDIERSIIQNQHQQNQHQQSLHLLQKQIAQQQQQQQQHPLQPFRQSTAHHQPLMKAREQFTPTKDAKTIQSLPLMSSLGVGPALMTPPPHLLAARNCALFPPGPPPPPPLQPHPPAPPLLNHANRLPLGLLPYNILAARPYSTPINNLAMHPAFPPHCPYGSPLQGFLQGPPPVTIGPPPLPQRHPPGPPGPLGPPPFLMQRSPTPLQNNQFNQRLVQEIQQNHPMLAFNRQLANSFNACGNGMKMNMAQNLQRPGLAKQPQYPQQQQQQRSRHGNGIPPPPPVSGPAREHDEYANMMSNRDKQWLIGIQLTQLNSDLPYWNDYYFTVFKQRLATAKGNVDGNRIYKENQQSHPFTHTPTSKEHAHLLLLSMLTRNVKGGGLMGLHRERRSSESKPVCGNDGKDGTTARSYTPFQFEKSLGKLQCGSVIAPRKLIDADVMGSDQLNGNGGVTAAEQSLTQRKARHVLLLIETLYKLLLKLEDKLNPIAIATANLLREKKVRERASDANGGGGCQGQLSAGATNGGNGVLLDSDESFDELCASLIGQLSQEKITSILGVRKGRILLRRSLAVLHDHPSRWTLWGMIFTALPCLAKKDRDDAEGLLLALFSEFERQLRYGTMEDLLLVAKTIGTSRKVMQCIASSKFLLSCIITIIFQMEMFCGKNPATLQTAAEDDHWWVTFLVEVNRVVKENAGVGSSAAGGNISINPDNNIVRTLRVHFARFGTRVDGTDLLNFITDNGNGQQRLGVGRKQSLQEPNVTPKHSNTHSSYTMSTSTSSGSSRMAVMDRDLCSLMVEMPSEKVTVRQKAFTKMNTILNNREDDFLAYMSSESFETAWSTLFDAVYQGIQKQSCTAASKGQAQSKNYEYVMVLHKLIELAMDREEAPQLSYGQLIGSFVHAISDQALRDGFGMCFLQVLQKFVLSTRWCLTTVSYDQWKDILDGCFVMMDSSQAAKQTASNCLSLAVVKFLHNCSRSTLLAAYLTRLMEHIRQTANEKKSNVLYELINTAFNVIQAIAVDCKSKIIQFLESLVPYTVKIYKEGNLRNEQKSVLFRLMHLSLIILYPEGKSHVHVTSLTKDCPRPAEDEEVCRKTLREYHYIVTSEMKAREQSSSSSQGAKDSALFCDGFVDFAARLCYTVYWNEDNWKESNSDESAVKRNKQFNKLQSIMDMIGTAPNHFNTRWMFILSAVLDRYEAAITTEDYMHLLQLLCNIQPTLQSPLEHNAFYRCCSELLNFEQKPAYRSLATIFKGEQTELWNKIVAAAFRGCTNTATRTCSESNLLLQLLIRHRKYPNVGFLNGTVLEAFYTYAVEKTNNNVGTVLCILDTVGSVECLGNVDAVLTKLFNYLYPQTRETKSKAILHAKERLSAKLLAQISILCVVTKRSAPEQEKIRKASKPLHTVAHGNSYQEQDEQLQTLEQRLRLHSLEELMEVEECLKQKKGSQPTERIYYTINDALFARLCELVKFDKHILPDENDFLVDGLIRTCYDLELYLQMLDVLLLHEAYGEQQCSKSPLYKKVLLKFDQLNTGFKRLLHDTSLNENKTRSIADRLLALVRGPYHASIKKLLQNTEHTMILRWVIGQIDLAEGEDSQCVTVLVEGQLSSDQQCRRCLHHILAEYLQYDGPSANEVHELLDKLGLNVYNSLDLFYMFDLCRILLKQTSHELVAVWVLRNIVEVCKVHYTNPSVTETIMDLYADLTTFVSPYEDMIRNVTIVLYSFVKQCAKHTYSTALQVKIFAQVKYLLRAYPQHIRTPTHENIYIGLVPLLSSTSYRIKLEAVRNILHFMKHEWAHRDVASVPCTFYEFQMELYDRIKFDELIGNTEGDDRVNVVSCCLQLLLGIFHTSFMLRRRALCDFVWLIQLGNVNNDKVAHTIRIASGTSEIDFRKLLQSNLDSVLELWLTKGNRLLDFPYRLAGKITSIEEFVQQFKKNIAFVILCMQPDRFEQFCKSVSVQQTEMVKSILPKCVSFLLPKYTKCAEMTAMYSVMAGRMHKALAPFLSTVDLKEHVTEIIKHLTYRLNESAELGKLAELDLPSCSTDELSISKATYATALEHLKQSVWGSQSIKFSLLSNLCLKNSSAIERTLTEVKRWLWAAEEPEQKMIHLLQYTVLLEHLEEYIGQQKERSFKPYLVRDVVCFLCNTLSSFPALRLATLNCFERFLAHAVTSVDATELLSEQLHFIVSSLLEVECGDPYSNISAKSLALLRFLILQNTTKFGGAISKLNYLPCDKRFDELRLMITRQKTAGHERLLPGEEIASLIELPNLRYEDLAALKIMLTTKKHDLKLLCDELSEHRANSLANGESILHRLIYILLEVVRNSPFDKRSIEALRCLGEIGPIDLGTMLLKSDAEMIAYDTINNSKEAIERCVDVLLSELSVLLASKNVSVANMAALVCYKLLYGKTFHALAAKLPTLHPFLGTSPEEVKLFSYTAGRELMLHTIFANERLIYPAFVQQLSAALLSFLGNMMLKKLAEQETTFAEKIVPLLVQIAIKQFEESVIDKIGTFINDFFAKFGLIRSDPSQQNIFNDPKAIQLMLTIVECARIHNQLFPQYNISINYLPVAQASQFCQAHFKAILYGELWYRAEEETGNGDAKRQPKLLELMKSCHLAIGVNDAVQSFLNPIQERIEYYRLEQNYAKCLVMQDATVPWRDNAQEGSTSSSTGAREAFLQTLKDSCLYGLARSLHVAPQQIDYECAWRLSDWNVLISTDNSTDAKEALSATNGLQLQSRSFERSHYTALKCLQLRDEMAVDSAIVEARRAVGEIFKLTSIESTKHIYHGLCRLRMLQQIEDFGEIHFAKQIDCEQDMLHKWKEHDELPHSEFTLMECILSQRLSIFSTAGIRAKRNWIPPAVYSSLLLLIHESRLRGYVDCAIRNVALIGKEEQLLPANIQSVVMLENAQLNWTSGHRLVARELAWEVMTSSKYNDPMVKAVAFRLYGEFQAEGHLQEIKSLCSDYFQQAEKCVNYVLSKQQGVTGDQKTSSGTIPSSHRCFEMDRNYTVQHTVAKYADREFVRLSKFVRSQEWEARKTNLARMEEEAVRLKAEAAHATDQRRKDLGRSLHFTHKNLQRDKKAAEEVEQSRGDYLNLALCYYLLYAKQTTIVSDMVIFRIISLWLNNQDNKNAKDLIEESLLSIPSYKFIAVLPQLTPRVGTDSAVGALVQKALVRCALDHPHHTLPFVFAQLHAFKDQPDHETPANDNRLLGAREVYKKLKKEPTLEHMLQQSERMNLALIELANKTLSSSPSFREYTMTKRDPLGLLDNLDLVHCPTVELPVVKDGNYRSRIVSIKRWDPKVIGVGGINAPKKLTCLCLNGTKRTQLLKGKDDMRQDAVMQQVFGILNILLRHDKETAHRKLSVRTYKVVPLSRQSGVLEWCNNTMPIGAWLLTGHVKYRPQDIEPTAARKKFTNNAQAGMTVDKKLANFLDICSKIRPVFRHYFLEQYLKPGAWFDRQQNYIKSVAASSMIGYVLGIGDRHVQNILIDKHTGEVIHIDFGIAFEMGKNLPTPETVPFRLTRDIVDGMGISGVEGVFRKSCEKTLEVLRNNQTVILAILEVLLYDPLYSWNVLSNKKANRRQQQAYLTGGSGDDSEAEETIGGLPVRRDINVTAERTLMQVEEKLLGQEDNKYISVEGQVQMLIFSATNKRNLCQVFAGWQPYL